VKAAAAASQRSRKSAFARAAARFCELKSAPRCSHGDADAPLFGVAEAA